MFDGNKIKKNKLRETENMTELRERQKMQERNRVNSGGRWEKYRKT